MEKHTKRLVIMGPSQSGKSSMKNVVLARTTPSEAGNLTPTKEIEKTHMKCFDNSMLKVYEFEGTREFMLKYLREGNFKKLVKANVLVYVIEPSQCGAAELGILGLVLKTLVRVNAQCKVFILLSKIDEYETAQLQRAQQLVQEDVVNKTGYGDVTFLFCSIYDISLYLVWSQILHYLCESRALSAIKEKFATLQRTLDSEFCILFERNGNLPLFSYSDTREPEDVLKYRVCEFTKSFQKRQGIESMCIVLQKRIFVQNVSQSFMVLLILDEHTPQSPFTNECVQACLDRFGLQIEHDVLCKDACGGTNKDC